MALRRVDGQASIQVGGFKMMHLLNPSSVQLVACRLQWMVFTKMVRYWASTPFQSGMRKAGPKGHCLHLRHFGAGTGLCSVKHAISNVSIKLMHLLDPSR